MMRVTTLYAGTAAATARYYTRYLADAPGELPGQWLGVQAAEFGLTGQVSTDALESLLSGLHPTTGDVLGFPLVDRTTGSGRVIRAVSGFDATLSAPKSVSVLWALTGDARVAECHDVAVGAVVDYLGRYGATTRVRSKGGRLHPDANGLTIAAFRQTTSRADDPQLHTHVVVSGKVRTDDGRWLALDARFLKQHQRALGGLYQSVLRAELVDRFGVGWGPIVNGQAETLGIPIELCEVFSKRAVQVDQAMTVKVAEFVGRTGRKPSRFEHAVLEREAAVDSRRKTGTVVADLRDRWLGEAAAVGLTPDLVRQQVDIAGRTTTPGPVPSVGDVIDHLTAERSAWGRMDIVRTVCDLTPPQPFLSGRQWLTWIDRTVDEVVGRCVELDPPNPGVTRRRSDGRSIWVEPTAAHITSPIVIAQEDAIITWALDGDTNPPRPSTSIDRAGLDVLQAAAAAAVAGEDRLVVVVGPAGAGKTTMLRAAVHDLHHRHVSVIGLSPTARAAQVLHDETGVHADTVAKLLYEYQRPAGPTPSWNLGREVTAIVDLCRVADYAGWWGVVNPTGLRGGSVS